MMLNRMAQTVTVTGNQSSIPERQHRRLPRPRTAVSKTNVNADIGYILMSALPSPFTRLLDIYIHLIS